MILAFIIIIPFDFLDIDNNKEINTFYTFLYIILLTVKTILYAFEDSLIKQFFNIYFILPIKMLFSIAIIETIILSIFSLILFLTDVIQFKLITSSGVIIFIILYILTTTIREYILMKLIYSYSPLSVVFLLISQNIAFSIIDIIKFISDRDDIPSHAYISFPFKIISIIIIILATSLYDEIIIINKWGLNLNIKKGIMERAQLESDLTNIELVDAVEEVKDDVSEI